MTQNRPATDPSRQAPRPVASDLIAGLGVIALSGAFAIIGQDYALGTVRRMGPGWFPLALGIIGAGLGVLIMISAFLGPPRTSPQVQWRRLLFIAAAFLAFALAVEPLGLPLTILLTTAIGAQADPASRPRETLLLGLGLAAATWVVFVLALGLPIPVFPGGR